MKKIIMMIILFSSILFAKDYELNSVYTIPVNGGMYEEVFFGTVEGYKEYKDAVSRGVITGLDKATGAALNTVGKVGDNVLKHGIAGLGLGVFIGVINDYKEAKKFPMEYILIENVKDSSGEIISKKITSFYCYDREKYSPEEAYKIIKDNRWKN